MNQLVRSAENDPTVVQPYQYWARVERVIDGDTLDLTVELGFETSVKARARLAGVDAPEVYGVRHDSAEYAAGVKAKEFLDQLIPPQSWVEVRTYKSRNREKYGRWICDVFLRGTNVAEELIGRGLAAARP